jgi:hypothetical protein
VHSSYLASVSKVSALRPFSASEALEQKALAELLLLRLFYRLEAFIEDVTIRICCGANYADGSAPAKLITCKSLTSAITNMKSTGRTKAIDLKWTMEADIKKNVQHVLDSADPFFATIASHSAELDRLRRTRNHIAHGNSDTSRKFRPVVNHHYGAALPNVTPGVLLLSNRFSPDLLEQAFVFARIFAKDLVRA